MRTRSLLRFRNAYAVAALLVCCAVSATAQTPEVGKLLTVMPMTLHQTRYRLRAGESARVDAPRETLDFVLHAKTRRVEIAGKEKRRGFVVGPNLAGDQILLAAYLALKPAEYRVKLSALSESGDERVTTLDVTVEAMQAVPLNATQPPVILLNGWQSSCPITPVTSPPSASTFDNLQDYLTQFDNVPVVYWFDNCAACPDCSIEDLGSDLAQVIGSIQYDNGAPVPQVDLIAHSMGGLIVRSYLSGKQMTSGVFDPPNDPKVRKAIFIATPHFGSYQAGVADFFLGGLQTNEMTLGSQFLLDLATWNQFGDDLRGTDALAIIGNAGTDNGLSQTSDGVVSLTSASLGFAEPDARTRIVDYCHIDFTGLLGTVEGSLVGCTGPGIAYIDSTSHPAYEIIQSFLANTTTWEDATVSTTPSQNSYTSQYGGVYFTAQTAADQYLNDLNPAYFGSVPLVNGDWTNTVFYDEFIQGTGTFQGTSASVGTITYGPWAIPLGQYTVFHAKLSPVVSHVGPLLPSGQGLVVQSGATITISGVGFGQQCSGCQVLAALPGATIGYPLQVSSWSDEAISAYLPTALPGLTLPGLVTIYVELSASAFDSINIMAAAPPSLAVAPRALTFNYTVGGTAPAAQGISITNAGGGTLSWAASSGASWVGLSPASGTAPDTLSVSANPANLSAGSYSATVQIIAAGASNSPVSIGVTLAVAAAPLSLVVAPEALTFKYTVGGAAPAAQDISITNAGGGTLSWAASPGASWVGLSPASGTAPATLSVSVNPANLSAGSYSATVRTTAAGASGSPASVGVTLVVQALAPPFTVALSTAGQVEPFAPQSIVSAYGTNLAGGTSANGTTVTVTDSAGVARLAKLFYVSPAQVNFEIPAGTVLGAATVSIQTQNGTTQNGTTQTATIQIGSVSPGLFALNGSGLVAALVLPVSSGVQQPLQPVYQIASGNVAPLPINLGPSTERVYLEMYGTGIRNANSVTATVGGLSVPVLFAGAAPGFAGEDQVNIGPLPSVLAGQGNVSIIVTADGQAANTVNVTIQQ